VKAVVNPSPQINALLIPSALILAQRGRLQSASCEVNADIERPHHEDHHKVAVSAATTLPDGI